MTGISTRVVAVAQVFFLAVKWAERPATCPAQTCPSAAPVSCVDTFSFKEVLDQLESKVDSQFGNCERAWSKGASLAAAEGEERVRSKWFYWVLVGASSILNVLLGTCWWCCRRNGGPVAEGVVQREGERRRGGGVFG